MQGVRTVTNKYNSINRNLRANMKKVRNEVFGRKNEL
jgi:hypothetical protein